MIKRLLLWAANKIYAHYNQYIEVKTSDIVKFEGNCFRIISWRLSKEIGYVDTLEMKLHGISEFLKLDKFINL